MNEAAVYTWKGRRTHVSPLSCLLLLSLTSWMQPSEVPHRAKYSVGAHVPVSARAGGPMGIWATDLTPTPGGCKKCARSCPRTPCWARRCEVDLSVYLGCCRVLSAPRCGLDGAQLQQARGSLQCCWEGCLQCKLPQSLAHLSSTPCLLHYNEASQMVRCWRCWVYHLSNGTLTCMAHATGLGEGPGRGM